MVMETPQGYKQTEVGLIPDDWKVTQLQELIDPDRKITYGIVVPGRNIPDGVPMIRAQDYSRGWVDINELYQVSTEIDKSYKRSKVVADDILLTIVGSVGNLAKVPSAFNGSNITQQTARLAFNKKIADPDFYLNILRSSIGHKEIFNYTKSGVQPSLNLSDVDKFRVPYPPLPEQKAIAQSLSDVDALITE
ncbi:restriction endonuclease subunit S [Calothrix membranacea FACHB-236]|nr:restriction endonuclease subunit S [Calothrix membranacea FACHB-236]